MLNMMEGAGVLQKMMEKHQHKMHQANTKASGKEAVQMAAAASKDGPTSSMVLTPVQGLELVNPVASQEHVWEVNWNFILGQSGFHISVAQEEAPH